jgi:hypothetical protein
MTTRRPENTTSNMALKRAVIQVPVRRSALLQMPTGGHIFHGTMISRKLSATTTRRPKHTSSSMALKRAVTLDQTRTIQESFLQNQQRVNNLENRLVLFHSRLVTVHPQRHLQNHHLHRLQ